MLITDFSELIRRKSEEKTAVLAEPGYEVNNIRAAILAVRQVSQIRAPGRKAVFICGREASTKKMLSGAKRFEGSEMVLQETIGRSTINLLI